MKIKTKNIITINFWWIIGFILISIPLSAYIDTIRTGTFPFRQYFAICSWEAGILMCGIALGLLIKGSEKKWKTKQKREQEK